MTIRLCVHAALARDGYVTGNPFVFKFRIIRSGMSRHVGHFVGYFEKFDEIEGTKRNRVRRRRLCLISSSMKFDITRTSPLNFMALTSPEAILPLKSGD